MTQQNPIKGAGDKYVRRLFMDTGFGYTEVACSRGKALDGSTVARIVEDYSPPSPEVKFSELKSINGASRIHAGGKSAYNIELRIIFGDKVQYADFIYNCGNSMKFYDELGHIYFGALAQAPDVAAVEAGRRYDVKVNLTMVKKNVQESVYEAQFTDIEGHKYEQDIKEAAHIGMTAVMDKNGNYVHTFNPEMMATRGMCAIFLNRMRRYLERSISQ